jgi:hypothetical protein
VNSRRRLATRPKGGGGLPTSEDVAVITQFGQLPLVGLLFTPALRLRTASMEGEKGEKGEKGGGGLEASMEEAGEEGPRPTNIGCIL